MNCQVIKYRGISVLILLPRVTRPNLKLETERSLGLLTLSIRISARLDDAKSKYCIHRRPFIMRIASTNNPYRSDCWYNSNRKLRPETALTSGVTSWLSTCEATDQGFSNFSPNVVWQPTKLSPRRSLPVSHSSPHLEVSATISIYGKWLTWIKRASTALDFTSPWK